MRWRQNGEGASRALPRRGDPRRPARSARSQILLLSGVGPAARACASLGIPVVLDRPGVGENLQDHLQLRLIYKVTGVKTLNADLSLARSAARA